MKKIILFLLTAVSLSATVSISAQAQNRISGTILDEAGLPLEGAVILIKGTHTGTQSDAEGHYEIKASPADEIQFEYFSYKTITEPVGNRTEINVKMEIDSQVLDNLVVVGYGVQKKVNVTGSVATVDYGEMALSRPVTTTGALLRGASAGVYVSQNSGEPGSEGIDIKIRGIGTFNDSAPLVIVDGFESTLTRVNPSDIETVSILKDAASCAIYGNRGANGVILITTKSAKSGTSAVEYNMMLSYQEPQRILQQVSDYADYMEFSNEACENINMAPYYSQTSIDVWRTAKSDPNGIAASGYPNYVAYPNINWMEAIFTPGIYQKHSLAASGANGGTKYRISADYMNNPGIIQGMGYKKASFRVNVSSKINDWVEIGANVSGQNSSQELTDWGAQMGMLSRSLPDIYPMYDGKYGWSENIEDSSLARNSFYHIRMAYGHLVGNFLNGTGHVTITLPLDIKWNTQYNYQTNFANKDFVRDPLSAYSFSRNEIANPEMSLDALSKSETSENWNKWTLHTDLSWNGSIGKGEASAIVGFEAFEYNRKTATYSKKNRSNEVLSELDNYVDPSSISGFTESYATESVFGRVSYAYDGRYMVEANFRVDGSSRFSSRSRWGVFPSVSAGWRINREPWMSGVNIDNLKLRLSWGRLGNHSIGNYDYLSTYGSGYNYPLGNGLQSGYVFSLSNDSLEWETTTTSDLGIDFAFLNNRFTLEADAYSKSTDGILSTSVLSSCIGTKTAPKENLYGMLNRGLEMTVGWRDTKGDFSYGVKANFTRNWNVVSKYLGSFTAGWVTDENGVREYKSNIGEVAKVNYTKVTSQGHLPDELFLMPIYHGDGTYFFSDGSVNPDGGPKDGMIRTEDDMAWLKAMVDAGNTFGPQNKTIGKKGIWYGDYILADVNQDRIYGGTADKQFYGSQAPKFYYGLDFDTEWKGFDFSVSLMGTAGGRMFWKAESFNCMAISHACNFPARLAYDHYFYDPDNPDDPRTNLTSKNGRLTMDYGSEQNGGYTDLWLQNIDFLKVKSMTLGYTLPRNLLEKVRISSARVFLSGDNLFTFTRYQGVDPEYASYDNKYSSIRQYTLGLNITF